MNLVLIQEVLDFVDLFQVLLTVFGVWALEESDAFDNAEVPNALHLPKVLFFLERVLVGYVVHFVLVVSHLQKPFHQTFLLFVQVH